MDRSHTLEVLRKLCASSISASGAHELCSVLIDLDDPRSVIPLLAAVEDPSSGEIVREEIMRALHSFSFDVDRDAVRRWFGSGDPILRTGAVRLFRRSEADLVREVLRDPTDPALVAALQAVGFGFEEPYWQNDKISFLRHCDASVRASAASTLVWDEPIAAEDALLEATYDESPLVILEAVRTLMYYPTMSVLRRLHELNAQQSLHESIDGQRRPGPESGETLLAHHVSVSYENVAGEFANCYRELTHVGRASFESWMNPVRDLVTLIDGNDEITKQSVISHAIREPQHTRVSWSPALRSALQNPDSEWAELLESLQNLDAQTIPASSRDSIAEFMCTHSDSQVRSTACRTFEALNLEAPLIFLLDDPCYAVRKSASYHLHGVSPSAEVAKRVILPVTNGEIAGTFAHEAIRTWARHREATAPELVTGELLWLVDEDRESVRCEAIEQLAIRDDRESISKCVKLLVTMPPLATWAVHGTLLRAAKRLDLDPNPLDHLRAVDNAWLQMHLAQFAR
jgi:HEAT repeat protein